MIVTVTPNTAIDRTLFVPEFRLDKTIRSSRTVLGMGGKGTDASWVLGAIGAPNRALGFAAGLAGSRLQMMLEERGSETDFVWVEGETRVNIIIVADDGSGQSTFTMDTLKVTKAHQQELKERFSDSMADAKSIIIGGSPPGGVEPQLYADLVAEARRHAIPVILDASGDTLRAALEFHPTIMKPNRDELLQITGKPVDSLPEIYAAARDVYDRLGVQMVVTLGGDGALAVLAERTYRIPPLTLEVVSTAGAGDAVLAGMAVSLAEGIPLEEGLRLGFAAAGAVMLTPATADCRKEDVDRLIDQVQLVPFTP
ncbi:MAG: 1-phosphofructokinase family hexose kinase [Anaerolineales bacterium]|nr:1-phosphofructokinase family hexose kinase [Anaerolineales bacterium]